MNQEYALVMVQKMPAILRHIALNLLRKEDTASLSIKNKRLMAGWDISILEKVLAGLAS